MPFKFENLKMWQESIEFSGLVNDITKKFPKDELYVLISQMKRAADSISLNIAEGSTGQTNPEFKKFLGYAIRSGIEVVSCIYLAKKRDIISDNDFNLTYKSIDGLIIRIPALIKSIT